MQIRILTGFCHQSIPIKIEFPPVIRVFINVFYVCFLHCQFRTEEMQGLVQELESNEGNLKTIDADVTVMKMVLTGSVLEEDLSQGMFYGNICPDDFGENSHRD